jgi:hypothetical protein
VDQGLFHSSGMGMDDDGTFVPFTDILFNALLGFAFMVFIAFSLINPDAKTGVVDVKAEMIITVTWPDGNPDDIDTYVEDPSGNIVWYHSKEAGLIHLDRDDRGNYQDTMIVNGERIENMLNQESVTMRGIVPGEYVVNIYHYIANTADDLPVTVKVEKINPALSVLHYGRTMLVAKGDEQTVLRFTLDEAGEVVATGDGFKSLAELAIKPRARAE